MRYKFKDAKEAGKVIEKMQKMKEEGIIRDYEIRKASLQEVIEQYVRVMTTESEDTESQGEIDEEDNQSLDESID